MEWIKDIYTLIRSYYLCFKVLPFEQAKYCPIIFDSSLLIKTELKRDSIVIDCKKVHFKMIRLGRGGGSFQMAHNAFSTLNIRHHSKLIFKGEVCISKGFKFMISKGGSIIIGEKVHIGAFSMVSSNSCIEIGNNVGTGWNLTIIDWDGHDIVDMESNTVVNSPKPILLGENSWVGANVTIMKGVNVAKNTIIPYGSIITKSNAEPFVVFGGTPNRVLKSNVARKDKI